MVYFAFAVTFVTTLGILIEYLASKSARPANFRRIPSIKPPGSGKVTSRIADLKTRGLPTDFASLETYAAERSVSRSNSAAWKEAFWYVSSHEFKAQCEGIYPITLKDRPYEALECIRQSRLQRTFLQRNADFIANLHLLAAQDASGLHYVKDSLRPARNYFDELTSLMGLLACEMLLCIEDRKCSRVLTCLETQINLLTIVPSTNLEVNLMYRVTMERAFVDHIRTVLNSSVLDHVHLRQLIDYLQNLPSPALAWEQVVICHRARSIQLLQSNIALQRYRWADEKRRGSNNSELLGLIDAFERYQNVDLCDWKSTKPALEAIQRDIPDHTAVESSLGLLHLAAEAISNTQSIKNQALLACALQLYRLQRDHYPERLDQLTQIEFDPVKYLSMSGECFGYLYQNQTAYLWGPVQYVKDDHSLEVSPTMPTLTPHMSKETRRRIEHALWAFNS